MMAALLACGSAGLTERPPYVPTGDSGVEGDTDSGSMPETGMVSGLAQFQLVQIACPDCLGYPSSLEVSALAAFHLATSKSWVGWLPAEGSCVEDPAPVPAASDYLDAGEWLSYRSGSVSLQLRQADGLYTASGIDEADFIRNAAWILDAEGGADVPDFDVENAFYTPESISDLEPKEMLQTTTRSAFAARVDRARADFTWSPFGGAGSFAVVLDVFHPDSNAFLGEVFCLEADNGSLRVPSGLLSGYPRDALLVIGMYRYAAGGFVRPDDGSTVETLVNFGVIGTGVLTN